jgi:hypothetical protein
VGRVSFKLAKSGNIFPLPLLQTFASCIASSRAIKNLSFAVQQVFSSLDTIERVAGKMVWLVQKWNHILCAESELTNGIPAL